MVGEDAAALELPLASLQRAEIAFPRRSPDLEYVFKHVSMRDVAYNTLVQRRRQELHLAAARGIASLYPSDEYVEMIAYHYSRTEEHQEAATWLEKAGDRAAAIYANETAINNYEEAKRRLERSGAQPVMLARVDEKLGEVLRTGTRYDEALEVLTRAVEAYRQVRDLEGVGRVTARIGWAHRYRGTPQEGITQIQPLLDLLAWSGPSPGLASLHLALAYLYMGSGRYRECLEAAEQAGELARAVGDERVLAGAEMRRGTVFVILGQMDEALHVLEQSVQLAEAVGDLETLGIALNNLGNTYLKAGELQKARAALERGLELLRRTGSAGNIGFQMLSLGEVLTYAGEWEQAAAWVERGGETISSVGASWFAAYIPLYRGHLALRQGRWEEAHSNLQEVLTLAQPIGDTQALHSAHWLLAELELLERRAEQAQARLEPLVAEDSPFLVALCATLAWAYLELGEMDRAAETVDRALRIARDRQLRLDLPTALQVHGMVLAQCDAWKDADAAFGDAVSLAHAMPYPYAEARARERWGMVCRERRKPEQARKNLEEALGIFRRLGARKDVERAEQALASLATV
jgi:tetratricopeptide (TPR) repeat protein